MIMHLVIHYVIITRDLDMSRDVPSEPFPAPQIKNVNDDCELLSVELERRVWTPMYVIQTWFFSPRCAFTPPRPNWLKSWLDVSFYSPQFRIQFVLVVQQSRARLKGECEDYGGGDGIGGYPPFSEAQKLWWQICDKCHGCGLMFELFRLVEKLKTRKYRFVSLLEVFRLKEVMFGESGLPYTVPTLP